MNYAEESLKKHYEWKGKISTCADVPVSTREELSLAYTPGVAAPCLEIQKNPELSFELTGRWNFVPVITDGTAILGLGDIGPEAGMPVMEGKAALFKEYGGVNAIPLCIKSKDTETIINTIKLLEGNFGGINLEDISAPRCFEIETRLKKELSIPVFHDDQHGTAIVMLAALMNALKVVKKEYKGLKIVINGAGAAGISIAKLLMSVDDVDMILCDRNGIICEGEEQMNAAHEEIAKISNRNKITGSLKDAMKGADVFIGVSAPHCVTNEMVASMNEGAIVFTCANPVPEIEREEALSAGAAVVGTGSSAKPNQINNVLVFPGVFRGALDTRARDINRDMMIAAAKGIAASVEEVSADCILPYAYNKEAHKTVARAVAKAAMDTGVARKKVDLETYLK